MKKVHAFVLLIVLFLSSKVAGAEVATVPAENLETLIATALNGNPELKASEARWQMYSSKVRQAASLDDPMVMFKMQNMLVREPLVFNRDPQSAVVVGISQQLPFWGKRAARKEIAMHDAESYKWAFEERKLELARMVKESYYQLWAVDKGLTIIENNLKILGDIISLSELKYSVSQGSQQDIYKAGLEKSKMIDMQIAARQQRRSLEANINYLLNRPTATPVGTDCRFHAAKRHPISGTAHREGNGRPPPDTGAHQSGRQGKCLPSSGPERVLS